MFGLGPEKLLVILAVALVVFGPEKLPEVARQVGRVWRDFQKFQHTLQGNVRDVVEPITGPIMSGMIGPPSAAKAGSEPAGAITRPAGGIGTDQPAG